jgi:hypothetical protein
MRHVFRLLLGLVLLLPFGAVAMAAQEQETGDIPEITIQGDEYSFSGPDQIQAGLVAITLENVGQEEHHAQLARLHDGVTMQDLIGALQESPEAAFGMVEFAGGPTVAGPGESQAALVDLRPGNYVVLCFVTAPDGQPHLAKGMLAPLEVVARDGEPAAEPEAAITAVMGDFYFELPAEIQAGEQTWKTINEGEQPHEIIVFRLAEGRTAQDVVAFLEDPQGPPPIERYPVGGMQALSTGMSGWFTMDLTPGEYVAVCFIPDPHSGRPHIDLGMVATFAVPGDAAAAAAEDDATSPPETLPVTGGAGPAMWLALVGGTSLLAAGWLARLRAAR